ncbi:cysteine desulfurase [Candidatus Macondimonas diazotrophica]|jgi:cysteine desulfurase/selenocysteine lyase|nr:cysteine desulfurase [Candidatus Macondimonas diazotrophica]HBG31417.1 cysteine desulfurase CsdA [Gammaproteobacteria bacterium]
MTAFQSASLPDAYDVAGVRTDFPILDQLIHGQRLVYLDNAATAQKPRAVLEAMDRYYREANANVHRGVHTLSERATALYEGARDRTREFLNAREREEIIFVRGTTEGINLVAQSYARPRLGPGDEILITHLEHHSNTVPWQMVCEQTGATLKVVPITADGAVDLAAFEQLLGPKTRIFAVAHVSNALGTVNPVAEMTARARTAGAVVLIDGAQGVPHQLVDVQALDCDFYAFSAHKLYGPTGIGVLYGRRELLESMPPWQGGGDMIRTVRFAGSTWNDLPYKFEAGTPAIAEAVGMGAAMDYVAALGLERIAVHEADLLSYAVAQLAEIDGLRFIGTAPVRAGVVSFVLDGVHPHDLGTILDHAGVAIRAGHHCAMPVMEFYGVPATARASFACYNTRADVDALVKALRGATELFGGRR